MIENGLAGNSARSNAAKGEKILEAGARALANLITDPETWAIPKDLRLLETGDMCLR